MKPDTALKFDNPSHILWIRTDSIGDNVLAASMLGAVADKFKTARITVLCQDHIAEIYVPCPFVDNVISFNKTLAYTDAHYREVIIRRIQALDVDIAMNPVYSRELIGDIFATRSGAKTRVGFLGDLCNISEAHRSSNNCYYTALLPSVYRPETAEIYRHTDFLRYFGIETGETLHPAVWTTPEDERFADEFFDRHELQPSQTLAVAPGSQNDYKIYPLFSEVLKEFTNFKVIILGGMDTVDVSAQIFGNFKGTCHNLTGKATLRQTAAIIRRSRHLLSSDSAAAHIATAVGTQNVVVLGGGHFGRFFPYSKLTTAVCLPLECYGCGWRCRFEEKFCITAIDPALIARAMSSSLKTPPDKPQIVAQGSALWPGQLPHWHDAGTFIDTALINIQTYDEIPELAGRTISTPVTARGDVPGNTAVNAIVERFKTASSQQETLSLYESYLEILPFDLNAAQTAHTLRLDIWRQRLPKITIVTPSFNQGAYLEQCILSVITQGYPNLEYIIMDGGSSDNSVEIIKKYQRHITYSKSAPDAGQYAAIDEGLRRATGEIMGWLNSDDKLHAGALWIVSLVFRAFSEVRWIMGRPTVWDESGMLTTALEPIPLWSRKMYLEGHIGPPHIQQESTFWRRQLWQEAGGYLDTTLRYAGDMELWARFFRTAALYSVEALIGGIRNHPLQKTAKPASDGSGYYDYGDYNSEAGVIIAREAALYNESPQPLYPPPKPVCPGEAALRLRDSILPENFSCFTYSRQYHRAYFNNAEPDTADTSIEGYRYNLAAAFAESNLPPRGKVIFAGGGIRPDALVELTSRYEVWVIGHNPNTQIPHGVVCVEQSPSGLPLNYFDLAVAVEPDQQMCNEIEQFLKTGAFAIFFFDAVVTDNTVSVSGVLPYVFSKPHVAHPYVDTASLRLEPGALCFDGGNGKRRLSYNVLWKKIQETPEPTEAAAHSFKHDTPLINLITVVAIANHCPEFIRETIADLANQTIDGSIELIIVDTASAANNQDAFIKEVRKIIRNTVFICAPEGSSTAAMWNIALMASSGEFITHLPKKSRLGSEALKAMAVTLRAHPEAALVYGDTYLTMGLTHGATASFEFHHCCGALQIPDSSYERLLVDCNLGPHPMWRKAVHKQLGYIDDGIEKWCERGLWLKIAERYKVLHITAFTGLMMQSAVTAPLPHELEGIVAKFQRRYCEGLRDKLASNPHIPVYIWGTGVGGHETYAILRAMNTTAAGFIDGNPAKWHTKTKGLDIIAPAEIEHRIKEKTEAAIRPFIVISSMYDSEIRPVLEGWGYVPREDYWTNIFRFRYAGF
ncbi:MAG: glycosyltransferase [Nitrospirae bacterium]|nr:glycosyltransferase [Nitrospirota bacterium]